MNAKIVMLISKFKRYDKWNNICRFYLSK